MQNEVTGWKILLLRRNVVAALAFLGFFNVYMLRVNLSVGIVSMTTPRTRTHQNGTNYQAADFNWDSTERGYILGSFFYGYILTQLLGGYLGAKFGGVRVYGIGVAVTAILTLFTPAAVHLGLYFFVAIRVLEGVFEGVTYPCIHAIWSKWAPPQERTRLASIAFSGSFVGTVVGYPLCGMLAKAFGWASTFYVPGVIAIFWCYLWFTFVKDNPKHDRYITDHELRHLENTLGDTTRKVNHPWSMFFTSMPVWAIVCAHFCENWGFYTLLTQLPTFMRDTFDLDIQSAGFLSALPYLALSLTLLVAGIFVDYLRKKNIFTTTRVRKICNCGAFISQTIFMMMAGFVDSPIACIVCLTLAVGLGAFAWTAFSVNHLDIAPQHASVLMGISNTFATTAGMFGPLVAGFIVTNKKKEEWRVVFYISSCVYLFGAIFYGIFASGERQPWAQSNESEAISQKRKCYDNNVLEVLD